MDTIFINSENSKTSNTHVLKLKFASKLDLRLGKKVIALSNLSIYYTWGNIKSSYNNNKFKIPAPTWNDEFDLPDGSYTIALAQVKAGNNSEGLLNEIRQVAYSLYQSKQITKKYTTT